MAKNLVRLGSTTDAGVGGPNWPAGSTNYFNLLKCAAAEQGTETLRDAVMFVSFTILKYWIRVHVNNTNSNSTFTLRKNAADISGSTITVGAGATGYFEAVGLNESVVAGDLLAIKGVAGGSSNISVKGAGILIDYTSGTSNTLILADRENNNPVVGTAGAIRYFFPEWLTDGANATESNRQARLGFPATIKEMYINVSANSATASSSITLRNGGVNTAATITVGSGATGRFSVTGLSVVVADTDLLSMELNNGTGGTLTIDAIEFVMEVTAVD